MVIWRNALRLLRPTALSLGKAYHIVEVDIKGFFDNIQHDWMMGFLGHRIGDKRVLRYVKRFLIAGVFENGEAFSKENGTRSRGFITPMLANIYLHHAASLPPYFPKPEPYHLMSINNLPTFGELRTAPKFFPSI